MYPDENTVKHRRRKDKYISSLMVAHSVLDENRARFLADMAMVGDALLEETGAVQCNYKILPRLDARTVSIGLREYTLGALPQRLGVLTHRHYAGASR